MHLTPTQIAQVTDQDSAAIARTWPLVVDALTARGIDTRNVEIGAAATIAVECPPWTPIREWGELSALEATYGLYYGRGLVQLTWSGNYRDAGAALGLDLAGEPDLALDPVVAARIFAWYMDTHETAAYAQAGNWIDVRRSVNGWVTTPNGWRPFVDFVDALLVMPEAPPPLPPLYCLYRVTTAQCLRAGSDATSARGYLMLPHWECIADGPVSGAWVHVVDLTGKQTGWMAKEHISYEGRTVPLPHGYVPRDNVRIRP